MNLWADRFDGSLADVFDLQDQVATGVAGVIEPTLGEGLEFAHQALHYGGDDAGTLGRAAYVLGHLGEDIDAAIALIDQSLQINPSFAYGWQRSGWLRLWAGQPDLAIDHFETALRLNPRDPAPATLMGIGVGHFFARRLEDARAMLLRSLQL